MGKIVKGTDIIFFINYENIQSERQKDIIFGHVVVEYQPQKNEPSGTQLTVGSNIIYYPGDISTPTSDTTTDKIV